MREALGRGARVMWPEAETKHLHTAGCCLAELAISAVAGNGWKLSVRALYSIMESVRIEEPTVT